MIIKIFNQGSSDGSRHIDYLLDEKSHEGYKPEVIEGNPELAKSILRSMTNRANRYTAGVISFKEGQNLTEAQQRELIDDFKKSFAPFDEESRSNFLFVRHRDKNRLEIHWVSVKQDMKTGLAWSIFVPGRANTLFYESFVRLQNYRYGFEQVDGKSMTAKDLGFYSKTFNDLREKRREYMATRYNKAPRSNKNNNRRNHHEPNESARISNRLNNQEAIRIRKLSELLRPSNSLDRTALPTDHAKSDFRTEGNHTSPNRVSENGCQAQSSFNPSQLTEWRNKQLNNNIPKITPSLSINEEILAISIALNTASHAEAPALVARLNQLIGIREHGIPKGPPKMK